MANGVRIIKANPFGFGKEAGEPLGRLKVAAYARVSTDSDEQEDSFERQVSYYTNFIQSNRDWEFVKVYSDPGISGTRAEARPGFMEMMEDCRKGRINRILVKSIARFARNTVDALRYIRELKELGISVFFEAHNLDTGTSGGEVLLTILAATAEEESRTISKNIKWTYQKKFERGEFVFNYKNFLGFGKRPDGTWEIIEDEAETVRRVYREFLCGASLCQIAKGLNEDGRSTATGKGRFESATVKSILTNEKYYGACIMGKTYKPDVLSKKRYKNTGQADSYYVENALPAIVSKETFDAAQAELRERESAKGNAGKVYGKFSSKYPFSKIVRCGCCGSFYIRNKNMRSGGGKIAAWTCSSHQSSSCSCPQKGISEEAIEKAFLKALSDLLGNLDEVRAAVDSSIREAISGKPSEASERIEMEVIRLQEEMLDLHKRKTSGSIGPKEYAALGQSLASEIDAKKRLLEDAKSREVMSEVAQRRMADISRITESVIQTDRFDEQVFRQLVDSITIAGRTRITFRFKVGIERTVEAEIK